MDNRTAQEHVHDAYDQAGEFGRGRLVSTFTIRHRRGLDAAFILDGATTDFQIGMGAASEDFTTVLTIGLDSTNGRLRAVSNWTVNGCDLRIPTRILHRSQTVIVVEAAPLPLDGRPASLKCWSFLRQQSLDHYSDVIGLVSPDLAALPAVRLTTHPRRFTSPPAP
ncbi:hypothetical protein [Rathayibacter sp. VKM Ac-2927]|uniref:hypothetical protein n=1 Tax=Rathayibacter sp. VKM Ac-2927 TaxID=2929478 RepID=UPI001FB2BF24|nr:hypothetical protein [Rathayibacter sp. VKM Ac-2927]MCJ1688469.1 hypothetical protein [Rathayibacter sp. VKM Ac-2927]